MRICFEMLDMLKAHKKTIRRATVNTFGYIARAVGPQDVLVTLLNNLKVQERQNRVCTTVAIAIVAETCGPFTVLPALLNEYRVQDMNVQNGVLKSLSFLFEAYEPRCWYFESVECIRRLALTGLLVFFAVRRHFLSHSHLSFFIEAVVKTGRDRFSDYRGGANDNQQKKTQIWRTETAIRFTKID